MKQHPTSPEHLYFSQPPTDWIRLHFHTNTSSCVAVREAAPHWVSCWEMLTLTHQSLGPLSIWALCYTGAKHYVCVMLPATDKPLWCESRHCWRTERGMQTHGAGIQNCAHLSPLVFAFMHRYLHCFTQSFSSCRMCIDMLTALAYQSIFQLDSSIEPCYFFFHN